LRLVPWKMVSVFRDFADWVNHIAFKRSTSIPELSRPSLGRPAQADAGVVRPPPVSPWPAATHTMGAGLCACAG
jgi:hypothetical protein